MCYPRNLLKKNLAFLKNTLLGAPNLLKNSPFTALNMLQNSIIRVS